MEESIDYEALICAQMEDFWNIEHLRDYSEEDLQRIRDAYSLAYEAHKPQRRKGGAPYITHPIAVAHILAADFQIDANTVIAGFLHDVVEDTHYTIEDIRERFGDDVAFLVGTVTKKEKAEYEMSKQMDNYKQMLSSIHYDIRSLLVKLADRLHNMRTLSSMKPDKQMKIAGETDYFYAPLAHRLGLYDTKTKLENLSMQYRCPQEYATISAEFERYKQHNNVVLAEWCAMIEEHLRGYGIEVESCVKYCSVYTLWRRMQLSGSDFDHVNYKYIVQLSFPNRPEQREKDECLKIYSALTDLCKEMPGSMRNYVDSPKENGYQALHITLLAMHGTWQKIHIASERMVRNSQMGCVSERKDGPTDWIAKFRGVLKDMADHSKEGRFMDGVVANFYNDDIFVFTLDGDAIILPKNASALDFAFEVDTQLGHRAQFARINGSVASVKSTLHRGDCVEIGTNEAIHPKADWLDHTLTYKARRYIKRYLMESSEGSPAAKHILCDHCSPLPGEEVIGFAQSGGLTTIHKRNCPEAIRMASQQGDNIINVEIGEGEELYPVSIAVVAIDRYHLLSDLVNVVTEDLSLSIENLTTTTVDEIVNCTINFSVHSARELDSAITHLKTIDSIEEVKRVRIG